MEKSGNNKKTLQENYNDSVLQRGMKQDKWQRAYEGVDFPNPEYDFYTHKTEVINQVKLKRKKVILSELEMVNND